MMGFLVQWPTVVTLSLFPVLVFMYSRLAKAEEGEALAEHGDEYRQYARIVPAFVPRLTRDASSGQAPPFAGVGRD